LLLTKSTNDGLAVKKKTGSLSVEAKVIVHEDPADDEDNLAKKTP